MRTDKNEIKTTRSKLWELMQSSRDTMIAAGDGADSRRNKERAKDTLYTVDSSSIGSARVCLNRLGTSDDYFASLWDVDVLSNLLTWGGYRGSSHPDAKPSPFQVLLETAVTVWSDVEWERYQHAGGRRTNPYGYDKPWNDGNKLLEWLMGLFKDTLTTDEKDRLKSAKSVKAVDALIREAVHSSGDHSIRIACIASWCAELRERKYPRVSYVLDDLVGALNPESTWYRTYDRDLYIGPDASQSDLHMRLHVGDTWTLSPFIFERQVSVLSAEGKDEVDAWGWLFGEDPRTVPTDEDPVYCVRVRGCLVRHFNGGDPRSGGWSDHKFFHVRETDDDTFDGTWGDSWLELDLTTEGVRFGTDALSSHFDRNSSIDLGDTARWRFDMASISSTPGVNNRMRLQALRMLGADDRSIVDHGYDMTPSPSEEDVDKSKSGSLKWSSDADTALEDDLIAETEGPNSYMRRLSSDTKYLVRFVNDSM